MLAFVFTVFTALLSEVSGASLRTSTPDYQFTDAKCPIIINGTIYKFCRIFINPGTGKYRCFRAQAENNLNTGSFPVYHNFFIPLCPGYEADIPCSYNFKNLDPHFSKLPSLLGSTDFINEVAAEGDLVEYKFYAPAETKLTLADLDTTNFNYTHYVHGIFPGLLEWSNFTSGGWSVDHGNKRIRLDYRQSHFADSSPSFYTPDGYGDSYHTKLPVLGYATADSSTNPTSPIYDMHKKENYFQTIFIQCGPTTVPGEPDYAYEQFVHNYTDPNGVFYYDGYDDLAGNSWPNPPIDPSNGVFLPIETYDPDYPGENILPHRQLFYSIGWITSDDPIVCDQLAAI